MVRMFQRIMDRTALCICLGITALLLLTSADTPTVLNLLGGFSAATTMGILNVVGIIRWILVVLPPTAISVLFITSELGPQSTFTMIRSKSVVRWIVARLGMILAVNLIYPLILLVVGFIFMPPPAIDAMRLYIIFSIHTCMVSFLSVFLVAIFKSSKPALLSFIVIEGCSVVVGNIVPSISKYMVGFWGMAQNSIFLFDNSIAHYGITAFFSIAVCLLSAVFTVLHLQKNNPAASQSNL